MGIESEGSESGSANVVRTPYQTEVHYDPSTKAWRGIDAPTQLWQNVDDSPRFTGSSTATTSKADSGKESALSKYSSGPTKNLLSTNPEKAFPKTSSAASNFGKSMEGLETAKTGNTKLDKKLDVITDPQKAIEKQWEKTKKTAVKKMDNTVRALDKGAADSIKSAKNQILDKINSLLVIPEPVLLGTLQGLAKLGGRADHQNFYPLSEMIRKDYVTIVEWMCREFNISPVSGKGAGVLQSCTQKGATRCAQYVFNKCAEVKGLEWTCANRYKELKKILIYGKEHYEPMVLLSTLKKHDIDTSGYGEKGCREFGVKYNFTIGEINIFLPERKKGLYWETYPRTPEHVVLFNMFLEGTGCNTLTHRIIRKRLRENLVIVNPIVSILSNTASGILKDLGVEKIVDLINNKESLMTMYLKDLKKKDLL